MNHYTEIIMDEWWKCCSLIYISGSYIYNCVNTRKLLHWNDLNTKWNSLQYCICNYWYLFFRIYIEIYMYIYFVFKFFLYLILIIFFFAHEVKLAMILLEFLYYIKHLLSIVTIIRYKVAIDAIQKYGEIIISARGAILIHRCCKVHFIYILLHTISRYYTQQNNCTKSYHWSIYIVHALTIDQSYFI